MIEKGLILAGVLLLFAGFMACIAVAGWNFEKMLREMRKPWTAFVLGPLVFLIPRLFTDAGIEHRLKFVIYLGLAFVFGAGLFFVKTYLGIG